MIKSHNRGRCSGISKSESGRMPQASPASNGAAQTQTKMTRRQAGNPTGIDLKQLRSNAGSLTSPKAIKAQAINKIRITGRFASQQASGNRPNTRLNSSQRRDLEGLANEGISMNSPINGGRFHPDETGPIKPPIIDELREIK